MNEQLKLLVKEILASDDEATILEVWEKICTGYRTHEILKAHAQVGEKILGVLCQRDR